jgi:D-alanyl-D-alanine carboxypeptidase
MARGRLLATTVGTLTFLAALSLANAAAAKYESFVMDAKTGVVLEEFNADGRTHPASLTKMMTLYLTFESLESGQLHKTQSLRVSAHAANQQPSKLDLAAGETITVEQAILALTVKSANDAAVVLAEAIRGSESEFAQTMTQKARELGMTGTTFRNASGLPNPGQVTTARDMAKLARALIRDYPQYYAYFSAREFTFQGNEIPTHNHVLVEYEGADGLKTGYIHSSGFNLVTSAIRNGRRLIGVVMGGQTSSQRDHAMMRLLDNGFATQIPALEAAYTPPAGDDDAQTPAKPTTSVARTHPAATATPIAVAPAIATTEEGGVDPSGADQSSADPSGESNWGIQVGAFGKLALAQQVARRAQHATPSLANAVISIGHVKTQRVTIYRARLVGLSESQARQACSYIQRHKGSCVLVTPGGERTIAQVVQ